MFDSTAFLNSLSTKWSTKHPEHADRIARGLKIALAGKVAPRGLDTFRVAGSKRGVEYTISINCGFPNCTCPDFNRHSARCKHIWSAALMVRLTAEIVAQMQAPRVRAVKRPQAPRRNELSNICQEFHAVNYQRAEDLRPLAPVLPLRR